MTIITTSRKPLPELRSLARDFAFATGCRYLIRGKRGLPEIDAVDPVSFLFSMLRGEYNLKLSDHGMTSADFILSPVVVREREGPLAYGLWVNDQSIYERLAPYIPVEMSVEDGGWCTFDGIRKRRYRLRLMFHEA